VSLSDEKGSPYHCSCREWGFHEVILPLERLPMEVPELSGKMMDRAKAGLTKAARRKPCPIKRWKPAAGVTSPAEARSLPAPPDRDGHSVTGGKQASRRVVASGQVASRPAGDTKAVLEIPV